MLDRLSSSKLQKIKYAYINLNFLLYVSRVCVRWQQEKAIRCIQEKDINSNGERSRSITAQTGKVSSVRFMDGVEVRGQTTTPLLYNTSSVQESSPTTTSYIVLDFGNERFKLLRRESDQIFPDFYIFLKF